MDKSKIGYIEVSCDYLEEFWLNNRDVVPLKGVEEKRKHCIRYLCWCKKFRSLDDCELIPEYIVEIKRHEVAELILNFNENNN